MRGEGWLILVSPFFSFIRRRDLKSRGFISDYREEVAAWHPRGFCGILSLALNYLPAKKGQWKEDGRRYQDIRKVLFLF